MKLTLAYVSSRRLQPKNAPTDAVAQDYISRCQRLCPTEMLGFASESDLLSACERQPGRPAAQPILFDSRGELLTSEAFSSLLERLRDQGAARVVCSVGGADGWSEAALGRAHRVVSLGRMTLPHELARAVVAEQMYRALTIQAGHPYHCGH